MEPTAKSSIAADTELKNSLHQIKNYLENTIRQLTHESEKMQLEIGRLQQQLERAKDTLDGKSQLINKLLGDLSKLQNDIDWYKRTYEKRSFLGTVRQKLFKK